MIGVRGAAVILVPSLILAALVPAVSAEPEVRERKYHLDNEFWTFLARDAGGVLASPLSWKPAEILGCAALLGLTGLAYAHDEDIQSWVQDRRTPGSNEFMSVVEMGGDAAYLLALLGGAYLAGEIAPSRGLRKTAVLGIESLAVSGAVVLGIKCLLGRARPELGLPSNHFEPFTFQAGFLSLPSGHAASAFAVATSIAAQVDSAVADAFLYLLAGLVAVSRVHDNKHWASDVLLGGALGHVVALKIAHLNGEGESRVRIAAAVTPLSFGLSVRF
ncbi:MAG: phosphatase PAP2 family protein [Candidatus Aminicenantes bacterium]|nr:phosphatase PAP2 family protein [Candidatus Aminicenantes bacterium]